MKLSKCLILVLAAWTSQPSFAWDWLLGPKADFTAQCEINGSSEILKLRKNASGYYESGWARKAPVDLIVNDERTELTMHVGSADGDGPMGSQTVSIEREVVIANFPGISRAACKIVQ